MKPTKDTPPTVLADDSLVPLKSDLQQLQDSRRAALNLMEDAIQSRQAVEQLNGQLRESEERYRTLFDAAPMAVFVCDTNAVIQHYNQRAVDLWGREPMSGEQHCGSVKLWLPNGTLLPHAQSPIVEVLRTGIPANSVEVFIERFDGSRLPVLVNFSVLRNEQGEITGAITSFVDITERKQAEEVRARLAAIVQSSDDAIISNDLDGVITSWNQGAERSLGYTTEEAIGSPISILLLPERRDEESRIFERIRRQEAVEHYDSVCRRKDGTLLEVSVAVSFIVDTHGQFIGASRIFRDITEHKDAQERLRQVGAELEEAVKAKTAELVQSYERLKAMATELNLTEQRERHKVAAELHDHVAQLLVLGKLKLGQSRRLTESPEKRDALMTDIDEVLSDALTYTRTLVVNLSPPILYEFGLPAAIKWLAAEMQRHELAVTVHIETEPPKLPDDQAILLFQSTRELLMNAAKHAMSGKATVRLVWRSGELRVEVCDEGVGFDLAAASTPAMSLQFGLFSIRERMGALGGRFELDSTPGQGTTATLTLPLAENRVLSPEVLSPEVAALRTEDSALRTQHSGLQQDGKIRILLVDDHAMIRQGLRSLLETYPDVEVVGEACNGEEAVAAAEALQPTVVLMDINMPKMNGIDATELIKARVPNRIVIGLSVNAGGANAEAMREAGAAMLLTKEAAAEDLYRAIRDTQDLTRKGIGE